MHERTSYSYCACSWHQQINPSRNSCHNFLLWDFVENFIEKLVHVSCAFIEIWSTWEVWRALKKLEFLLAMPQATLTHLLCSVVKKWEAIYPLHPNINAYILHTFLFNSLWYQHGEFVFTIGRFLNWWLFPWFSCPLQLI